MLAASRFIGAVAQSMSQIAGPKVSRYLKTFIGSPNAKWSS
jgi:hypothetical protein